MNMSLGIMMMWSGFLFMGSIAALSVFAWAVKNQQFADQEHAKALPLLSAIPREEPERGGGDDA